MINNDPITAINDTTAAMIAATARRLADANAPIIMPDRPADRSRNGRRIPRSVKHRANR